MDDIDFFEIAKDDLLDCKGDESTAEYVANLLQQLYMLCPHTRQDINQQWDTMNNLKAEREIKQDWFLSDTAWEDYYNDNQIEENCCG